MSASAGHTARPMLAAAYRVRTFVRDHSLGDRPFAPLWPAKTYFVPAGTYQGSQIWGTSLLHKGAEFKRPLQTLHLIF